MKVFLIRSTAIEQTHLEGHFKTVRELLSAAGHQVEVLNLLPIGSSAHTLSNLASYRLLETATSADVIICLDAVSAVLRHPRKLIVLLDDSILFPDDVDSNERLPKSECKYLSRVLQAALREAAGLFVFSNFAAKRVGDLVGERVTILAPTLTWEPIDYAREAGPELLILNPLSHRQRPDLLVDCLSALPEPFRARWIAPFADPKAFTRLDGWASKAGLEQRLAVDVRQINKGEKAYFISRAAAVLELAPAMIAAGQDMQQAIEIGVPVISCTDGGALTEYASTHSLPIALPHGNSVASTVHAALKWRRELFGTSSATDWAPLLKAVG